MERKQESEGQTKGDKNRKHKNLICEMKNQQNVWHVSPIIQERSCNPNPLNLIMPYASICIRIPVKHKCVYE